MTSVSAGGVAISLDAALAGFHAALAACRARGLPRISFWWRDDDMSSDSAKFQRLSALSEQFPVGPLVAIIPGRAAAGLADTLARASEHMWFAQHGFVHVNHESPGALPSEFSAGRPAGACIREITEGRAVMLSMNLPRFLDVFVPPWNRIDPSFLPDLSRLGFTGLSGFEGHSMFTEATGRRVGLAVRHTNVEVTRWGKPPAMLALEQILVQTTNSLQRIAARPLTVDETSDKTQAERCMIGILTHHRVMQDFEFQVLADFFTIIGTTSGCEWIGPRDVFA